MISSADSDSRRGLASCLGGMGAVLLAIALELAAPILGVPGLGRELAFSDLLLAIAGAVAGAFRLDRMERSAGRPTS